ncbi:carbonic anhydrase [Roseomonas sp. CCTCC AB2023176]|uniref:carbonic anhydrase n=1 Tax=Roseomonas sp. CCTCC AB2023176 TaxID=3342640 RepID=UPI0035DA8D7A
MIACVDSRVAPEVIFDADPGEMVVVRNVANLVPPYQPDMNHHGTSAAIEFAVRTLEVRDVVVMGHAGCSGVAAFRRNARAGAAAVPGDFVSRWMEMLAPAMTLACEAVPPGTDPLAEAQPMELAAIRQSLRNLRTFPWVAARERDGRLRLHGLWFDVHEGEIRILDEAAGTFRVLG